MLLLICCLLGGAVKINRNDPVKARNFLFLIFLILVLFAGLRNVTVGTDTFNYVGFFLHGKRAGVINNKTNIESGYILINNIARFISGQYWVLLTFIAAIIIFFELKVIHRLSQNFLLSIFIYISLGIFVFLFNGARQAIAAAIFGMAIYYLIKGSFKKYILWIIIAAFFHKTVLIGLPLYYFLRSGFSLKKTLINILVFSGILLLFFLLGGTEAVVGDRYEQYIDRGALGGGGFTFFYTVSIVLFMYFRKYIPASNLYRYDIYLNMALVQSLIYLFIFFLRLDVNFYRLAIYFSLSNILIWPIIFKNVRVLGSDLSILFFVLVHLLFLYIYIVKNGNVYPYILNKNIF
ncbi:MAG: EpsG family protein [Ginsengibacter sp.]